MSRPNDPVSLVCMEYDDYFCIMTNRGLTCGLSLTSGSLFSAVLGSCDDNLLRVHDDVCSKFQPTS